VRAFSQIAYEVAGGVATVTLNRPDRLNALTHAVVSEFLGTLDAIADMLRVKAVRAATGEDKLRLIDELGGDRCIVIGNGANDMLALEAAALGIAVLGPEGASSGALRAADLVCNSASDALDLLLDPTALSATIRP